MPRKRIHVDGMAVSYRRVSTTEQAVSGLGLAAQEHHTATEIAHRGWTLVGDYADEGISGKSIDARPQLRAALEVLRRGDASILIVAKLDRLTRSLGDLVALMSQANREGWRIVACDLGLDMTTPMGEAMAAMAGVFAQLERRLISQRTIDALAVKRAQGVRLGRPTELDPAVRLRIVAESLAGRSNQQIAEMLNAEGIPTARGAQRWSPSTVWKIIKREAA